MTLRITLLLLALLLSGCVNQTVKSTSVPPLAQPPQPIPDAQVLDVGVAILDPGIGELQDDDRVYPEIRRAEATFIARELTTTLEEVGAWGAVRVVPDTRQFTDLLVTGKILHSDGEHLEVAVTVTDARGIPWIEKTYEGVTSRYAYENRATADRDPFLLVYRQIANDMLTVFNRTPASSWVK